ncbi:uncharacterized protein LTR77_005864 [Saxophila tyrrhenica]|uniref:Uncharacterized protein n=1 Tax=Saxophila tyrrhenica TaxID=1690608 RepID=A0AAV9P9X7_9PEZI|nr:hypothetical protein LTR77_005864 [Saxophila tyrrhenica]
MSLKLWKQILGLNPFKGSYFGLFRTLDSTRDQAIAYCGVLFAIAAGVPLPIIGVIFAQIIGDFPPDEAALEDHIVQLIGIAVAYFVVTTAYTTFFARTGERIAIQLRRRLLRTLLYVDQAFLDVEDLDYNGLLRDSIDTIQVGCSEKVGIFIQSMSYFVAAFTVGFILNAKLTGILFAAVIPSMIAVVSLGSTSISKYTRRVTHHTEKANAVALSALRAVKIVQAFDMIANICQLHSDQLSESARLGLRKAIASALELGGAYFVAYAANALAFYVGSHMAAANEAGGDAGTIYAVVFLILDASFVVGQFAPFLEIFSRAASAYGKILEVLEIRPTERSNRPHDHGDISLRGQDVRINNVTFAYPARPDAQVLNGLDMHFQPGTFNAVVGTSGGGKSTLVSLLLRVYDYDGSISIGNHELMEMNKFELRSQIAVLDQDCVLFSGSIFENIRYGLVGRSLSDADSVRLCEQAAADAGIDFLPELSNGIHTVVDNTTQLSGGQRQRVCLARALVSKPAILILDEPTSALDARSELKVMEAIRTAVANGITVLMIAHRLSTVLSADQVTVLQDGRAVEQGTPAELTKDGSIFSGLLAAQAVNGDSQTQIVEVSDSSTDEIEKPTRLRKDSETTETGVIEKDGEPSLATISRSFLRLTRPDHILVAAGAVASMISGGMIIGEAIIFGHLVQLLNTGQGRSDFQSTADFYCLMFFVLACIALLSFVGSGTAFGIASSRLVARVQAELLKTVLRLDLAWFAEKDRSASALASTFAKDSSDLSCLSGVALGTVCTVIVSIIGGTVLAHVVAWKIAVVLLGAVPVMIASGFIRINLLGRSERRHRTAYSEATGVAVEVCHSRRTVAILGLEELYLERYHEGLRKPYKAGLIPTVTCNLFLAFSLAITYFVYALAYWWGSRQVRNGTYNQQQFFTVLPALLFSAQSAGQLFSLSPELARARTAAASIFKLLSSRPSILTSTPDDLQSEPEKSLTSSLDSLEKYSDAKIQFRNVSFSYSNGAPVLDDVSFGITEGQTVALVGPSGAGKSSIVSLFERFYDPTAGEILFDGTDLRDHDVRKLRGRLSLLSQDAELFPGSIRHNIALGASDRDVSQQEIEAVANQCGIHDFVSSLPEGYTTECGAEGNSQLSGGQRSRIALARALLRNPECLLLDEPTASLDAVSEKQVQEALQAAAKGRTTVIVAHRLASIQHADNIIVLDGGRVVEQGSHAELVQKGGLYASMAKAQALA